MSYCFSNLLFPRICIVKNNKYLQFFVIYSLIKLELLPAPKITDFAWQINLFSYAIKFSYLF